MFNRIQCPFQRRCRRFPSCAEGAYDLLAVRFDFVARKTRAVLSPLLMSKNHQGVPFEWTHVRMNIFITKRKLETIQR
jgi:hypothetical protein